MRITRGAGLVFLLGAATPAWSTTGPLTLKQAIQTALERSPAYHSALLTQSVRDHEYHKAIAKFLPSIDVTTTNGLQNNVPISSNNNLLFTANPAAPWYSTLTAGVSETLYDNGASLAQLGIANLNRDFAELSSAKARDTLILGVASEFYTYSLAATLLDVRRQQQATLARQFDLLSDQFHQGFKTRADYLRMKTQVQRAELDRIAAEDTIAQSVARLRKLLGVSLDPAEAGQPRPVSRLDDPTRDFVPVTVARAEKFSALGSLLAPALDLNYDARLADLQEQINNRNVELVVRNYWPQLLLTTGMSYNNQNYLNSATPFAAGHQLSWNALVTLQFNVWDWGARRRDVAIAGLNRDIQEDTLRLGLMDDHAQVEGLMADLARTARSYQMTRELLSLEEESYALVQEQYRNGKVAYLDLITSLNSLLDARVQFYTAYFDALQGRARYDFYDGKLHDTIFND